MESDFKKELLKNLEKDKVEILKEAELLNKDNEKTVKEYEDLLKNEKENLEKDREHLKGLLNVSKKEYKLDKKNIKEERKKYKKIINQDVINVSKIRSDIDEINKSSKSNLDSANNDIDELSSHLSIYLNDVIKHDDYIIESLTISALKTKIKLTIKQYDIEKIPSNPRIGMSIGSNYKPRIFVSNNVRTRTKKVITRNETFEVHQNDDPDIRLVEISNYLGIIDPFNLQDFFYNNLKKYQGQQYINNFFKKK